MANTTRWSGPSSVARPRARFDFSFLVLALSTGVLALGSVGCGEVKKCKKGELGCIGEEPNEDGECLANLVEVDGLCVDPDDNEPGEFDAGGKRDGGTDGGRDSGADAGRDSSVPGSCECADPEEVCSPDDGETCLNYCEQKPELKAVDPPPPCRDYSVKPPKLLPFATACKNACLQDCKRAEVYCPGYVCDPASCEGADVMAACTLECPTSDPNCITPLCEGLRDLACAEFECPAAFPKSCTGVTCNDSCTGNTTDGFCDDGDPLSASYDLCNYGTDCGDCGPRRGSKAPVAPLGGQCVRDVGCPGFDQRFLVTESWCVNVDGAPPMQFSCIPNCTGLESDPNACTEGFACQGLLYSDGKPFVDAMNRQAYGCFPQACQ